MAAGTTTEILMQFVPTGGIAIAAECNTVITASDQLANLSGYGMANGFQSPGYFLVDTFKFGVELHDGETSASSNAMKAMQGLNGGKKLSPEAEAQIQKIMAATAKATGGSSPQSFSRWRSATDDTWRRGTSNQTPYNARIDDFSFTRRIDKASTILFDYCCKQKSFAFASLVKRKSAFVPKSDLPENQSYLRLDFEQVLISSLKWSDDDVVEETCTFRAKKMRVQFWTETFDIATQTDGVLGPYNDAKWENTVAAPPKNGS